MDAVFSLSIKRASNLSNLSNLFSSLARVHVRRRARRASRAHGKTNFRLDRLDRLDLLLKRQANIASNPHKVCARLDATLERLDVCTWRAAVGIRQESDEGYSVTAIRHGDRWGFTAWGPDKAPDWAGDAFKVRYALGEQIPQRFELLGCADTAEQARALCDAHSAEISDGPACRS